MNDTPSDDLDRFKHKYHAHVADSKEYREPVRISSDPYLSDTAMYAHDLSFKTEPCVAIHLSKGHFRKLVTRDAYFDDLEDRMKHAKQILQQSREDERVRNNNPAVQNAWQKYLTLLELARK